jgi:hypothetical protein
MEVSLLTDSLFFVVGGRGRGRRLRPLFGKVAAVRLYLDAWVNVAAPDHVIVEPRLHDDDAWRVYLQWYTSRALTRVTYVPPNPRLDLVPASTYPYRRDQYHNI